MLRIRRILVPIDWSEPSLRAFQLGASLAREQVAEMVVLHVMPPPMLMYGPPPEAYVDHLRQELCAITPGDPQIRARHLLLEGDPAAMILATARDSDCDLIVMGTHGRTGLNRLLMGSVAERVVRQAPCLVVTVKDQVPLVKDHQTQATETRA